MHPSSDLLRRCLTTAAVTIPPILFLKDTFYSLYRVEGSSMEPSLFDGDILLVRKADIFPHRQWNRWASKVVLDSDLGVDESEEQTDIKNALRVIALDAESQRPIGLITGYTWLSPPTIFQLGSVVVYRAPDADKYPLSEYRVKRIIGLGGQIVQMRDIFDAEKRVPSFGLWLEGDNHQVDECIKQGNDSSQTCPPNKSLSVDSGTYGPVCKNLLVGIAERVVWPPSRWGLIPRVTSLPARSRWPDL